MVVSKLELKVSCRNLANKDLLSKSDPQVILYLKSRDGRQWVEVGRTEIIKDNLNPRFAKSFLVDYHFEQDTLMRFLVVDIDNEHSRDIKDQDILGETEVHLSRIVTAKGRTVLTTLVHGSKVTGLGTLKIVAEEILDSKTVVSMRFAARKLDKKDFFGKSDPFFCISRSSESGEFSVVYRSQHILKTLDPIWEPFTLPLSTLCGSDRDRLLLFEVYDWNKDGSHELIGQFKTTVNELVRTAKPEFELVDPKKMKKSSYRNSGIFLVDSVSVRQVPTFLDYINGGMQINLSVGIDFTQSNGHPMDPSSLHYRNPHAFNLYQKAICSIGGILQEYDTDKSFPAFGFGAKLPTGMVSHAFPLNNNPRQPEVFGVQGILDAYNWTLSQIELYGPTNFSPLIRQTCEHIHAETTRTGIGNSYHILLILTDGEITDLEHTVDAIIDAASLPVSIIIVGVGDADFSKMEFLDSDDKRLTSLDGRKVASRDIVQFVPMRKFGREGGDLLAREVLAELPDQLVHYFQARHIQPRPARVSSIRSITSNDDGEGVGKQDEKQVQHLFVSQAHRQDPFQEQQPQASTSQHIPPAYHDIPVNPPQQYSYDKKQ